MTTRHPLNPVIAEMETEQRTILKSTRIDLDGFLALGSEGRAARWQQWSHATKRQAVGLMLERRGWDWTTQDELDQWIAKYDARWQPPTPVAEVPDAAVAAELERLAEEHAGYARTARAAGLKDDARYFQRSANSFVRALTAWNNGVRPVALGRNKWLLPSSRPYGTPHLVRLDGDFYCTCQAAHTAHWATCLIIGIDAAQDQTSRDLADLEYTPALLGARLAEQRRRYAA